MIFFVSLGNLYNTFQYYRASPQEVGFQVINFMSEVYVILAILAYLQVLGGKKDNNNGLYYFGSLFDS